MFKHSYLLMIAALIFMTTLGVLLACALIFLLSFSAPGQDTSGQVALGSRVLRTSSVEAAAQVEPDNVGLRGNQASVATIQETFQTVEVVKILTPSVVQIVTEFLAMDMLNLPVPGRGVGTGVILDQQGHILTNNHVIDGAQRITVTLSNGKSLPAQVVGGDATTDTAVIRVEEPGLQPALLGLSSDLEVGQEVIAIGHALGLPGGPTVSKGVISALGRSIRTDAQITMVDLIQTDAAINPGNSGGPLLNTGAEVIGINTAGILGSQGISFAINIDDAMVVVEQLIARGYVDRGFLGISPANLPPSLGNQLDVPVIEGLLVVRVVSDSPAAKAGLQEEDVIVELGDESIRNTGELSKFLIAHPPGDTVSVVYFRGNEKRSAQVTLAEQPKS
ncbi:MAG: trypsin-like peptidase domain-containing protein [Chloroflexi bacterium]|nr:trypsin-like peptidase domain-containing protein [Chloroflexota bacterium]